MQKVLFLCLLTLTSCQTGDAGNEQQCGLSHEIFEFRDCARERHQNEMSVCQAKSTWIDKTDCKTDLLLKNRNDPYTREIAAYTGVLIEKVNAKKMTPAEAEYAREQKIAQVNERLDGLRAQNRQLDIADETQRRIARESARQRAQKQDEILLDNFNNRPTYTPTPLPTSQNSERTDCTPNALGGGFSCTTYK